MIKALSDIFGGKTFGRLFLATIWSCFAMYFINHIITTPIAPDALRFVDTILGFLMGTIIAGILGYYFGSSQSSTDKDKIIANSSPIGDKSVTISETDKTKGDA